MAKTFQYDGVPLVQTKYGKLQGYFFEGAYIYKGIPYAKAQRFQMPQPPDSWEGVKPATSYGYVCPLLAQDNPTSELMVPHRYWPQSEHCQNLNVWTKQLDPGAKKPVLVWLHGGAFVAGSSIEQVAYDGQSLCVNQDVVVVTVNHRLNILGYLDLSPFGEKYANSANLGHADLVAALGWVRDNIAAFGGDPDNVTLFGQSGGGMKVTGLMQIPAADGLFHKGVVMSGVFDGKLIPQPSGDGRQIAQALLTELGLTEVEQLDSVDYYDLARAYNKVSMQVAMQGGYVGCVPMPNEYYKGEPLLTGFTDHAKSIPLLIGSVFGEFAFAPSPYDKTQISPPEIQQALEKAFGEHADILKNLFAQAYPEKHPIDLLSVDRVFRGASKDLARLHAQGGKAPAYLYNFTLNFPIQQGKPAWHCSDIPFFFHNTDLVEVCNIPEVTSVLQSQVATALVQFAKTGDPNHSQLPHWAAVTPQEEATMLLDAPVRVGTNYDDDLLAKIEEVLPPFSLAALMSEDIQH